MRIHFAGSEDVNLTELMDARLFKRTFVSFYYLLKSKPLHHVVKRMHRNGTQIIMDSGAHTFFNEEAAGQQSGVKKKKKEESDFMRRIIDNPELYHGFYFDYITQFKDLCTFFCELDIGSIVGLDKQIQWLEKFRKAGLGHKIIPAYHKSTETFDHFFDRIKDWPSRYVALEGMPRSGNHVDHIPAIRRLYEAGIRVHGFAMTKRLALENMPFYSVDSTSFKAGVMWGKPVITRKPGDWTLFELFKPKDRAQKERMAMLMLKNRIPLDLAFDLRVNKGQGNRHNTYVRTVAHALMILEQVEEYYTRYWLSRGIDWPARMKEYGIGEEKETLPLDAG